MGNRADDSWRIGPRVVGGRYEGGYWHQEYTVLALGEGPRGIVVMWDTGEITAHCTPWDPRRDRVVEQAA